MARSRSRLASSSSKSLGPLYTTGKRPPPSDRRRSRRALGIDADDLVARLRVDKYPSLFCFTAVKQERLQTVAQVDIRLAKVNAAPVTGAFAEENNAIRL